MEDPIYDALLKCIREEGLFRHAPKLKVALVGEYPKCHVLKYRLMEEYNVVITEFTRDDLFTIEEGERFDVLIGCRACEGERLVLESATKYNKRFILLPCLCSDTVVGFVREFPIITHSCNCAAQPYPGGGYPEINGWIVLYNFNFWPAG